MIKENDLPDGWFVKQFVECIEKEASSNKLKIQKNSFQNEGEHAIIDQSVKYIAGYTDDYSKLYKGDLPVIIFGDHTRIFKFVDFPFALGADGTKILVPKKDILHPKYFYYFLLGEKIENHGYSRHYKFLKEKRIVVPPLQTQKKIVAILEKAERLKEWRKKADELTDEFLKSTFLEMFGDSVTNPKEWTMVNLEDVCAKITDGEHATPERTNEGIYLLSARNVRNHKISLDDVDFIGEKEYERISKRIIPKKEDILLSCSGTIGRVTRIKDDIKFQLVRSVALLRPKTEKINPIYLEYSFDTNFIKGQINKSVNQSSQANLFQGKIKKITIPLPPLSLQQKFASIVQQVEQLREHQSQSRQHIDDLFNALMQKAFRGELEA